LKAQVIKLAAVAAENGVWVGDGLNVLDPKKSEILRGAPTNFS